jgi:hypothetical protein
MKGQQNKARAQLSMERPPRHTCFFKKTKGMDDVVHLDKRCVVCCNTFRAFLMTRN